MMASSSPSGTDPPEGERPFPPGDYPVVVVGSGPGGLQLSYSLDRLGVDHAVLSADDRPGGMFRRWPVFQRLLSWTKPHAPADRASREFERYDWNSLLADEPQNRALQAEFMDGSSSFPARFEMEQNLAAFAERTRLRIRHGTRWTGTRVEETPEGERFVLETTDGEYRTGVAVFAVGVADPWVPSTPWVELGTHYAHVQSPARYAGRRVFIAGKQNSGFELANGLLPWACQIVLASPSPTKLSVDTRSLVGVRARYVQPFEDHVLGGGVSVLDAAIDTVAGLADGSFRIDLRRTDGGPDLHVEADDVILATGFVAPLLDLPSLGVPTFGQARIPAQTPWWESVGRRGIYFAGTISQGAAGLKKHGMPSNSGAVQGARYNARILARHLAETRFGRRFERPPISPGALVDRLLEEAAASPELWHQRGYLAWMATVAPTGGYLDEGFVPLVHALDQAGPDAIILTVEADGTGAIYPVVYVRRGGELEERLLDPDPFLDFATPRHRQAFEAAVARLSDSR